MNTYGTSYYIRQVSASNIKRIKEESIPLDQELESDAVDSVLFTRKARLKKGKWKLFPPEVEEEKRQEE